VDARRRPARRPGDRQLQPARLRCRLRRHQQDMSKSVKPDSHDAADAALTTAALTAAERERILAKAVLFAPPPARLPDGRSELVGLSRAELAAELAAIGEPPFRAKQLWHWIYRQGATDFAR